MRKTFRKLAAPTALVLGIGGVATAMQSLDEGVKVVDAQAAAPAPGAESLAESFRSASRAALQGVVHVQVESAPRRVSQSMPYGDNPFEGTPFEDFFRGAPMPSPGPQRGSGSGFIITPDGYVLTNNHVVENATRVMVTLTDRRQFDAEVVGRDPNTDVAVLKIDADGLPTVRIATQEVEIGDWVLALGYPLSLGETVTAGIVSAKGRSIGIMAQNEGAAAPLEHFIQTDAAINPGNSGGPLVNLRGEAIGINSAIASPTGMYAGYGFAVPISLAKRVADDLIRDGTVHRPRLGIQIRDVTPADIDVFSLQGADGSVVASVQDGPAQDAGVELGDVIVAVNGERIIDTGDLMQRIALHRPGDRVTLDIVRYGRPLKLTVSLGEFPSEAAPSRVSAAPDRDSVGRLGFAAAELSPELARRLEIEATEGVVITEIDPTGSAPRNLQGLRIESINGRKIENVEQLRSVAAELESGDAVSIIGTTPDNSRIIVNYTVR